MATPVLDKQNLIFENQTQLRFQNNILQTIGNTPLIRMNRMNEGMLPLMLGKMEFLNPGGSSKDRIGIA
ncbi:MAG: hypothetical protein KDD09_23630, partial [Phaeodactylibacter sp.]|nr:hypothetical protein [Phaeodactylibacter sp.]